MLSLSVRDAILHFDFTGFNLINFTRITKKVIQLIQITMVGTYVCIFVVLCGRKLQNSKEIHLVNHMTISHADAGYQTLVPEL